MERIYRSKRHGMRALTLAGMATAVLAMSGCGGGGGSDTSTADLSEAGRSRTTTTTAVPQPVNTEGRLLASNCFQCHGTMGTGGFDKIRGSEASEVLEFLTKNASQDIMAAHAQGYTRDQLKKVIAYLQQ